MTDHTHDDHEKELPEWTLALAQYVLAAIVFALLAAIMAGLIG